MEAILDFWQGHGKTAPNEKGEKRGGALPWPSNPDNMAAGGATDTKCGEGGRCPMCIRRGFDKNFARNSAEQKETKFFFKFV